MKANINLNQSNKNTENAVNRIQNSLNKLQSVINNNKSNASNRNNYINKNKNIRKKFIDSKNNYLMPNNNIVRSETNFQRNPIIGYSMFNNNSVLRTDKKTIETSSNPPDLNNFNFERITNNKAEYVSKTNLSRNKIINKNNNYVNNMNYRSVLKWKCMKCNNINLIYNKFCINCGSIKSIQVENLSNNPNYPKSEANINYINNSYENINNNYNINNSNFITNNNSLNNNSQFADNNDKMANEYNKYNLKQNDNYINKQNLANSAFYNNLKPFNPIENPERNLFDNNIDNSNLTGITDNNNKTFNTMPYNETNNNKKEINLIYKKLNDLYLYGDYLENELKESNDENIKLLEKYKNIKNDVHNLNQKNKKIKQNVEELKKKEKELNKLNDQLKKGFSFVQQKAEKVNNDNLKIVKELEIENNKCLQKQKNSDNEIETLKKKINLLVKDDEDEENNEEEKKMVEMEKNIEKDKKDILENNNRYILLLKDYDLLNKEIEQLQKKLESNENNEKINKESPQNLSKKLNSLKDQMLLFDKEIKQNKMMTNNLINEYKDLIDISDNILNNNDNKNNEPGKNEYLLIKERNNKLTNELSKLKNIIKNLKDSKEKIIEIYEDEINKLNIFYQKAKEKTMNDKKEKVNNETEEKIMKIIKENDEIKNENFELLLHLKYHIY